MRGASQRTGGEPMLGLTWRRASGQGGSAASRMRRTRRQASTTMLAAAAIAAPAATASAAVAAPTLTASSSGSVPEGKVTIVASGLSKSTYDYHVGLSIGKAPSLTLADTALRPRKPKRLVVTEALAGDLGHYVLTYAPTGADQVTAKVVLGESKTAADRLKTLQSTSVTIALTRPTITGRVAIFAGADTAVLDVAVAGAPDGRWVVAVRPASGACTDGSPRRELLELTVVDGVARQSTPLARSSSNCLDPASVGQQAILELVTRELGAPGKRRAAAATAPLTIEAVS